jgi:hypothetical protein
MTVNYQIGRPIARSVHPSSWEGSRLPEKPIARCFRLGNTPAMALKDDLLRAIDLATAGSWGEAHSIVQQHEDDTTASWIHAVLHKIEGDLGNSHYWYRRAGKMERAAAEPMAELAAIRRTL